MGAGRTAGFDAKFDMSIGLAALCVGLAQAGQAERFDDGITLLKMNHQIDNA